MARPKSKTPRKVPLHVTIDADQLRWLKSQAKATRVDVSQLVRLILWGAQKKVSHED